MIEETLRHSTVVHWRARRATTDVVLGGVTIRAGDRVHPVNAAANRDPVRYPHPDTFDIDPAGYMGHLAFNVGPRHCAGAWLARLETYEVGPWPARIAGTSADSDTPHRRYHRVSCHARCGRSTSCSMPDGDVDWLTWRLRKELGPHTRDDLGTRALYTSDASNYRVVPPSSWHRPEDELASSWALAAEAGVPLTMRGAGTSIAGNAIGSRRGHRTQAPRPDPGARPGGLHGDRPAGRRPRRPQRARGAPRPARRAGPVDAQPLHDRRDGRQQRLRLALGALGHDRGEHAGPRGHHGRRRAAPAGVARGRGELALPPTGRLDGRAAAPVRARPTRSCIRRELPPWPRRVSGYALDWLLPERGADVARALVGTEGTCAVVAGATIAPRAAAGRRVPAGPRLRRRHRGAAAVPALLAERPFTVESLTAELLALVGVGRRRLLPAGRGVAAGRGRRRDRRPRRATMPRAWPQRSAASVTVPDVRLLEDAAAQAALWRIREDGAGHAARLAGRLAGLARASRMRPCRPTASPRTCASCARCCATRAWRASPTATSARAASTCGSASGWTGRAGGALRAASWTAAADLVVAHGGSLSGEHGDGRARGRAAGAACSARRCSTRSRGFKAALGPERRCSTRGSSWTRRRSPRDLRATAPDALDVRAGPRVRRRRRRPPGGGRAAASGSAAASPARGRR